MKRRKPRGFDLTLAELVNVVAADYVAFLHVTQPGDAADPKTFGARHAAAKVALAHLEQLMKFVGSSDDAAAERLGQCAQLLIETRRQISQEEQEPQNDDEGERC